MKTVLEDHLCYVEIEQSRPRLFVLEAAIAFCHTLDVQVKVKALLDTGNDITIVRPEKVLELEEYLKVMLPVGRTFLYYGADGSEKPEPAYDLAFIFPGGHSYSSGYGFIAPSNWYFGDIADVWVGQDIFSQLVTTFDGAKGTVTIIDPEAP
jgi:hypothetical protein